MTDELVPAALIPPPRRWTPAGLPSRPPGRGPAARLDYRPAQPVLDTGLFSLNTDPPPEASGAALMQGLADHAAVVAPLSAIERGSTIGDEGPINEAFLSTPVVRLIAGAHYILRSAVLVPAGGLLYLNGATVSDLDLIILSSGARIVDQPRTTRQRLHFGGGLIWRADGANELANLPAGQIGQHYNSRLEAAGGTPPYVWNITGTLPPGLHLDVPQNWQVPLVLARYQATTPANPLNFVVTQPVPSGSRLLMFLGHSSETPSLNPQPFTDPAGNTYEPYPVPAFEPQGDRRLRIWQCHVTQPITPPMTVALDTTGFGGGMIGALVWVRGGASAITASRAAYLNTSTGTSASLPAPIGDPGQIIISMCRAGSATGAADPAWTPESETQQLSQTFAAGSSQISILGINYPGDQPQSPAASWDLPRAWSLVSVQMAVSGVPAPGGGVVTIGRTEIDGDPTTPGSYPLTLTVTDQAGLQDSAQMVVVIAPQPPAPVQPPSIVTFALPAGQVGVAYTAGLAVAGGVPPWTWGAIGLPAGLSLDPQTGIITGTPTTAGTFPVTITVADANGAAAVATFDLDITPAPAPPVTP